MDIVQESVDNPSDIPPYENEMPRWVKIVFWLYALFSMGATIVAGTALAYIALTKGGEILPIVASLLASASGIIAILIFIFGFVLQIFYGIGILRLRRWTLPLVLTFSLGTVVIGILILFNFNVSGVPELIVLLMGIVFMGFLGFLSIKHWNHFSGPARKLLVQVPFLLVLLPLIVFAALNQIFTDDSQINDSDLLLPHDEIVSQSDNAFYALPDIENLSPSQQAVFDQARDYYASLEQGEDINILGASSTLATLTNVTDEFIEASKRPDYQCPYSTNKYGTDTILCPLNELPSIAQVVAVRSYIESRQGNTEDAFESALALARLGNSVSSGQPLIIEHLVGIALTKTSMESIQRVLDNSAVSRDTALYVSQELNKYQFDGSNLAISLKREYMSMKDTSKPFAEFSNYFYQHNKTMNEFAEIMRQNIEVARKQCGSELERKTLELSAQAESSRDFMWWMLLKPNGTGEMLKSIVGASLGNVRERECEINEINTNVQNRLETTPIDS